MNSGVTVFSKVYYITMNQSPGDAGCEAALQSFVRAIGKNLAHNEIIVGHIKVLAKLPGHVENFFALSLTRLDTVDVTSSEGWRQQQECTFESLELSVNVHVFGYTLRQVENVVHDSMGVLRKCTDHSGH